MASTTAKDTPAVKPTTVALFARFEPPGGVLPGPFEVCAPVSLIELLTCLKQKHEVVKYELLQQKIKGSRPLVESFQISALKGQSKLMCEPPCVASFRCNPKVAFVILSADVAGGDRTRCAVDTGQAWH
jgi:hypothetical protein